MCEMGESEYLKNILIKIAEIQEIEQFEPTVYDVPIKTEGFLSDLYTGTIKDKSNGQIVSVAIKRMPKKKDCELLYKNENNFYSKIYPELNNFQTKKKVQKPFDNIPKYFCGNLEPDKEYIAMENLKDLGYCLVAKQQYFDEKYLNRIFKTYGKFHALSFAYKDQYLDRYNEIMKNLVNIFDNINETDLILQSIENNVLYGLKVFDNLCDNGVTQKLKKMENVKKIVSDGINYKGEYKCITHGDCWSNNMLFKHSVSVFGEIDDMKLLDFQMAKEGNPVLDLAFLFYSGASKKDFDNLYTYLRIYYKSFSIFAKELGSDSEELLPWNVLKSEWKECAILGAIFGIDLWVPKLMDDKNILELRDREASKEEMVEMWEIEMGKVRNSDAFKERTRQIILHLIEHDFL